MNELYNTTNSMANIRKALLATASALVLAAASLPEVVHAADNDRPTIWIEGGWHFESVTGERDPFLPRQNDAALASGFPSLAAIENTLGRTYGGEGSISFQPKGSDWVFTASARYGRAQTSRRIHDEKTVVGPQMQTFAFATTNRPNGNIPVTPTFAAYAIHSARNSESHAIADFQVGKDVGVGLLGRGTDSIISFGARYAQMNAKSNAQSIDNPDADFVQITSNGFFGHKYRVRAYNHVSHGFVERTESLHALGPSLSMKNTTGLLGTVDDGQLALDWGMNAALLFGRQKTKTSHHSTIQFRGNKYYTTNVYAPIAHSRSRTVTIPNVGGFAGLSYRFINAKITAGYRADFFFGAMDGGLDVHNSVTTGFHGPYATLSIGLGG